MRKLKYLGLATLPVLTVAMVVVGGDAVARRKKPKPEGPLSSMVAVTLMEDGGTGADNIADLVKTRVDQFARGTLPAGVEFPLANEVDDRVRTLPELGHNVVAKWLDPIAKKKKRRGPELSGAGPDGTPRFGANADYIAYFGEGWDSDWVGDQVGSAPQWNGSADTAWVWVNHEYISNSSPRTTSAPNGQHLTYAKFLRDLRILRNDVESNTWDQRDVDTYIREWKRQIGGSWMRIRRNKKGVWRVDVKAQGTRYDSSGNTLVKVQGHTLSGRDHDDAGRILPEGVVVGVNGDCSGGQSPWGTVITAEENVQFAYGDLEATWTSNQKFLPGNGFDPGANISPVFGSSDSSDFGRIQNILGRHNRDNYGFLVEMDPGAAPSDFYESVAEGGDGRGHRKVGPMGRARWENCCFAVDGDWKLVPGKPVVMYGGNDRRSGRIWKWVSAEPYTAGMTRAQVRALLDEGSLFVAHFDGLDNTTGDTLAAGGFPTFDAPATGRWIEMSVTSTDVCPNATALGEPGKTVGEALQDVNYNGLGGFPTDNDVRLALFTAAAKVGVMELNRPEDIEWNPDDPSGTPTLYVAFTKNGRKTQLDQDGVLIPTEDHDTVAITRPDPVGSIFAMVEEDPANPATSATFEYVRAWQGTQGTGPLDVANPDNLMIDREGGVWFGTDGNFGRNGTADALYYLDLDRSHQADEPGITTPTFGLPFRVLAGPGDSEATGPCFNSDMTTVFFAVQHPGEDFDGTPSTWPQDRKKKPKLIR